MQRKFDKRLKLELVRRGLTQVAVARVLGIPITTFRDYIEGYRPLPDGFESRFRAALDLVERADRAAEEARSRVLAGGVQ